MKKIAMNQIRQGYDASVTMLPSIFGNDNVAIAITTATGSRLYYRPHWCPSVRRLCRLIGHADIAHKARVSPSLFQLGYIADLKDLTKWKGA